MKNINKKLIILLVATVLLLTFFVGCEEETPPIQGTKAKFLAALKTETDKISAVATVTYDGDDIEVKFKNDTNKPAILNAAFGLLSALKDDIKVKNGSELKIKYSDNSEKTYTFNSSFDNAALAALANDIYAKAEGADTITVNYFATVKYIDNSFSLEGELYFEGFEKYFNE
jgi:hypothetical protein